MPTMNDIVWNYASNLSSTNSIIKSYAKYLRSGVDKAKEMLNSFSLALQGEMTDTELDELFTDEVYYYKNCLVLKSNLIKLCKNAVTTAESLTSSDLLDYESIMVDIPTIDGPVLNVTLSDVKMTLVSALDSVYFSSVLFSSADPLTNDKLTINEKMIAKSQLCSEAISQIPNVDATKISNIQSFIDSISDTTYDSQAILSILCNFCGFNILGNVSVSNVNDFLSDIPVVELDQYTGETPFNGFINSVTDKLSNMDAVQVLDIAAGFIFPAYGTFKLIKAAAKYAPKVISAIGDSVVDLGANVILDITNTTMDPVDFILDSGSDYSLCSEGFNAISGWPKKDFLSNQEVDYSILNLQQSYVGKSPITFETIFGNVSIGYSSQYDSETSVIRLKPFNFTKLGDLVNLMSLDSLDTMDYTTLQSILTLIKPDKDFNNDDSYQLRNKILNGLQVSAICLPIVYLPIYYYLQILNRLKQYDVNTTEGARMFRQLYNALFINQWDGLLHPVNIGDIDDGVAMEMVQGLGSLLYHCTLFTIKAASCALNGTSFSYNETIPLHNYNLHLHCSVNFKAYNDVAFSNTKAISVALSTPIVTRSGSDPTTVHVTYVSDAIEYTVFGNDYYIGDGWTCGETVYDIFWPLASFIVNGNEAFKTYCYLPYIRGSGNKPTFHIATDKENIENFQNSVMIVALGVATVVAVAAAIKLGIRMKRSFQQTQALIQTQRNLLGQAILSNDSASITTHTKELMRLQRKSKFLNVLGAGSLASTSEVLLNSNSEEVVDSVCSYVNTKIGA